MQIRSYGLLALFLIQLSSCALQPRVEGSADVSHSSEGGVSATDDKEKVGLNVMFGLQWGILGAKSASGPTAGEEIARSPESVLLTAAEDKEPFSPWAIEAGLQLITKGSKYDGGSVNLTYVELLADLVHQWPLGDGILFAGGGPYIGYGVGGKAKYGNFKVNAFGGEDGYKRFDAGLHLKAGYQLPSSLRFSLGYELGLVDKSPTPDDYTSRNRTLSFNIGYSLTKIVAAFKK